MSFRISGMIALYKTVINDTCTFFLDRVSDVAFGWNRALYIDQVDFKLTVSASQVLVLQAYTVKTCL